MSSEILKNNQQNLLLGKLLDIFEDLTAAIASHALFPAPFHYWYLQLEIKRTRC